MSPAINTEPVLGDVYRAYPSTSASGDKHGANGRPVGVVELDERVVFTLTRTTHPEKGCRMLESPRNPSIGLTEDGYWTDRNQRPLARKALQDVAKCEYLGRLPDAEKDELCNFWGTTKLLGRKNL